MPAVVTSLDFSIANGLRSRMLVEQQDVTTGLQILRRVRRQYVTGVLPRLAESNVEQSWNEQVFARVLGYQTQFSHDRLPFHLKAKNYQNGYFSDFSLGYFGVGRDRVLATAELKGPTASLDAPQGAKYGNLTPVQQAFRTARREPDCLWVIVSNFTELRLYDIRNDAKPLAIIDLSAVIDARDLAMVAATLGPRALLGDARRLPELRVMNDLPTDHPASPLPAADDHHRLVTRFTPRPEQESRLFEIEQAVRSAVTKPPGWCRIFEPSNYGRGVHVQMRLADGWVGCDWSSPTHGLDVRVAVSLLGQVQTSMRFRSPKTQLDGRTLHEVEFVWILNGLRYFAGLVEELYHLPTTPGMYAAELREAFDKVMDVDGALLAKGAQNSGIAQLTDISVGDFRWDGPTMPVVEMAAVLACELAAYFRGANGGIGVDLAKVKARIDQMNQTDRKNGC